MSLQSHYYAKKGTLNTAVSQTSMVNKTIHHNKMATIFGTETDLKLYYHLLTSRKMNDTMDCIDRYLFHNKRASW